MKQNKLKYGPWALVTGASRGIGAEFARQLAASGFNLVLTARDYSALTRVATWCHEHYKVETKVVALDLCQEEKRDELIAQTEKLEIGLFVCNAGFGAPISNFTDTNYKDLKCMLELNIEAVSHLSLKIAQRFAKQSYGGIVLLSSLAAFCPAVTMAAYGASKSYVLYLGQALAVELRPKNIDLLVLAPGGVDTDMPHAMGLDPAKLPQNLEKPQTIVKQALQVLGKKTLLVPGMGNKALAFSMQRLFPLSAAARLWGHFTLKGVR